MISMKTAATLIIAFMFLAAAPEADVRYFAFVRDVEVKDAAHQNFLVLDADLFQHADNDFADLRLYDGSGQTPFNVVEESGGSRNEEHEVRILNLAANGDHTEFDLDMQGVSEYDNIRLQLDAKDFVVKAWAAGGDELHSKNLVPWPTPSTLYDFSAERLGSSTTIKLPTWSFRYVHVKLGPGIKPEQVQSAVVSNLQGKRAIFMQMGSCHTAQSKPRQSIWQCDVPEKAPLDRFVFEVAPQNVNFRRPVSVQDERGGIIAGGEISRIRTRRGGTDVVAEELTVPARTSGAHSAHLTVAIENGDDMGLEIRTLQPQSFERRLYFAPAGTSTLRLYFGDAQLQPPVYDYAKVFQEDPVAAQATFSPTRPNPDLTPRPDTRPWSDRHPAVLWVAMVAAVVMLAGLALRGLTSRRQ